MHDIWNPWHGCRKASEGCANCYMFTMDRWRGLDGSVVRRNKATFRYPLPRLCDGSFKVRPGELIRVCMTSDFLVEEADAWRDEAWDVMRQRPDVRFWLLTKRPERFAACLPDDWGEGWDNVMLNVTCENQRRADERIAILLATPARHKGIMCAPLIGRADLSPARPPAPVRAGVQVRREHCRPANRVAPARRARPADSLRGALPASLSRALRDVRAASHLQRLLRLRLLRGSKGDRPLLAHARQRDCSMARKCS